MNLLMKEEARSRRAALSGIGVDRKERAIHRFFEISVGKDDVRALAA